MSDQTELERRVAAVRALHYAHEADVFVSGTRWCDVEGDDWPCPTIRLLDGLTDVDPRPDIVEALEFRAAMRSE